MRATRMLGITMATVALLAACGGGGSDKSDTDGSGSGSGTVSPHEQMCQQVWEDGGKDQAAASGQSKGDYMADCIKAMGGGATTTSAP